MDRLIEEVKQVDKLIIYYSGHGHLDKRTKNKRGYWIPTNAEKGNTARYLRNSVIRDYLQDIESSHTLLISDSCFSGSLFVRGSQRIAGTTMEDLEQIPSRWAICSGRHDEVVADGVPGQNSPFAAGILKVLNQNAKPYLNVAKLADRVVEMTRANYDQLPEGNPIHGVGHEGGQYIFKLRKNEQIVWESVLARDTILAYNNYLNEFPSGKNAAEALARIEELEEKRAWEKAKKRDIIFSYRNFLIRFPDGIYKEEARKAIRKLEEQLSKPPVVYSTPAPPPKEEPKPTPKPKVEPKKGPTRKEPEKIPSAKPKQATTSTSSPTFIQEHGKKVFAGIGITLVLMILINVLPNLGSRSSETTDNTVLQDTDNKEANMSELPEPRDPGIDFDDLQFVKGGTFKMGSTEQDDEQLVHSVTLSDFYIGKTEVTFEEYDKYCEAEGKTKPKDRGWGRGKRPVIYVDWYDAIEYCNWLSGQNRLEAVYQIDKGKKDSNNSNSSDDKKWTISINWNANGYRLPTEAEWEYAARSQGGNDKWAGTSSESSLATYGNYYEGDKKGKDGYQYTAPVGSFQANNLGLHDMSGNVWEWCWDWYDENYYKNSPKADPKGPELGSYRVLRGGSWFNFPAILRCSDRSLR